MKRQASLGQQDFGKESVATLILAYLFHDMVNFQLLYYQLQQTLSHLQGKYNRYAAQEKTNKSHNLIT